MSIRLILRASRLSAPAPLEKALLRKFAGPVRAGSTGAGSGGAADSVNQALRGLAHRSSPSYLALALNRVGFDCVYAATDPPNHPDYRFSWLENIDTERDGALLRGVFVASWTPRDQLDVTSLLS